VAEFLRLGVRLGRTILGLSAIAAVLALSLPIADSLWAQRLIGAGTVHTGRWTPEDHGCTHTPGYWKTHPEAWPQDAIEVGGVVYLDAEAIAILETLPRGDASYILAHQLIAATVNLLNEADESVIAAVLQEANAWLVAHPLGSDPQNPDRERGIELSIALADYNEGRTGPGLCDDDPCSATATSTASETPTATPSSTATDTATIPSTATPTSETRGAPPETSTPAATPSETHMTSPTDESTPTLEATPIPTETVEAAPTEASPEAPTDTAAPPPETAAPETPA
jgi:hypothetical protein